MTDRSAHERVNDTLAGSPKDPATGRIEARPGPLERPGTEAEEKAKARPPEPPGDGPGRPAEQAAAYRENDA